MTELDTRVDEGLAGADQATTCSRDGFVNGLIVISVAIAVALGLGIWLALWLSRSISRPLKEAVDAARQVAEGQLSVTLDTTRQDEIGELFVALRTMANSLSSVVEKVRSGVDTIAGASIEIAAANVDLSSRTEQVLDGPVAQWVVSSPTCRPPKVWWYWPIGTTASAR